MNLHVLGLRFLLLLLELFFSLCLESLIFDSIFIFLLPKGRKSLALFILALQEHALLDLLRFSMSQQGLSLLVFDSVQVLLVLVFVFLDHVHHLLLVLVQIVFKKALCTILFGLPFLFQLLNLHLLLSFFLLLHQELSLLVQFLLFEHLNGDPTFVLFFLLQAAPVFDLLNPLALALFSCTACLGFLLVVKSRHEVFVRALLVNEFFVLEVFVAQEALKHPQLAIFCLP